MILERFNQSSPSEAQELLRRCCGSQRWIESMEKARPFPTEKALLIQAADIWNSLSREDWLEAFSHHPRIGDPKVCGSATSSPTLESCEQAGTLTASQRTLAELEDWNRAYLQRFGYVFLICATGQSADEMLSQLKRRIKSPPEEELKVAAEEQLKIMHLRLQRVLRD